METKVNSIVSALVETIENGICKDLQEAKKENTFVNLEIDLQEYINAYNAYSKQRDIKLVNIWDNDTISDLMKKHHNFNIRALSMLYKTIENSNGCLSKYFIYSEENFNVYEDESIPLLSRDLLIDSLCNNMSNVVRYMIGTTDGKESYKNLYEYYITPLII